MPEKTPTKTAKNGATKPAGYAFVASGVEPYQTTGVITANSIYQVCDYLYIAGPVTQMTNLIISGEPTITVYDGNNDAVEDVSRALNIMFSQPNCSLASMARSAVADLMIWGPSIYNWVWERVGGKLVCNSLTRLHPYTFRNAPTSAVRNQVLGRVLRGVVYNQTDRRTHYYQTTGIGIPQELDADDLFIIKDPSDNYPDGESVIYPIVPIVEFLNYAWDTLGQQMFRVGAPLLFIKITNPRPAGVIDGVEQLSDIDYAQQVLANWGKDTGYTLRDNFEIVKTEVTEGSLAVRAIDKAGETIRDYLNPVGMLGKDGTLISGSSDASLRLLNNYLKGWIRMLEDQMGAIPNRYLKYNSYPDDWHAVVRIPQTPIEDRSMNIQRVQAGISSKSLFKNEIRALLGMEELSEAELLKLHDEYPAQTSAFGFAENLRTPKKSSEVREKLTEDAAAEIVESTDKLERGIMKGLLAGIEK